jgi:hypothetical protein
MSTTKVIRYRTHPEQADENERLIRAVFAELDATSPDGIRYAAVRLDDQVSFLHLALLDDGDNPLARVGAFGRFQAGIATRCVEPPAASDGTVIGAYRAFPG